MLYPDFTVSSDENPEKLVFLLHGYGSNGADLIELGHFWAPSMRMTKFIAPNALQPCDVSPLGYQWFGIKDFDILNLRHGLEYAAPLVAQFIKEQVAQHNLTMNQVALIGFSQGTMLALELMFHLPGLAGIIGYSGAFYPPPQPSFNGPFPPVLLVHGTHDTMVPYVQLSLAEQALKKQGCKVDTLSCPGLPHSIDVQGLHKGLTFLQEIFTKSSSIIVIPKEKGEV